MDAKLSSPPAADPPVRVVAANYRWWLRVGAGAALCAISLVVAASLDRWIFAQCAGIRQVDWVRPLRTIPAWFGEPIAVFVLATGTWAACRSDLRSLMIVLLGVVIAAVAVQGLKHLIGRERPKHTNGESVFRGPVVPQRGVPSPSFPSAHTTVAFALAGGLSRLCPRGRYIFLALACACGMSRILSESHFLSDVVAGVWLGWGIASLAWRLRFPLGQGSPARD
jgi:membrane-associated phospholipid phosphatase